MANEDINSINEVDKRSTFLHENDVIISGMSGRFPECDSIAEFAEKLYDGIDLVNDEERRWPKELFGVPSRMGKLKNLKSFDAAFFGVHAKQAEVMDPQLRLLLETSYEAIIDAGVNPTTIRGSNTGVFIGVLTSESEDFWNSEPDRVNGYGVTGFSRAMFANRISYAFDLKGPSYAVDSACSSGMYALYQAFVAMRMGKCDAAIVGASNLLLKPTSTLQFQRLGVLSPEGICRSFDAAGNGYVRSEAIVTLFLQKSSDVKRIYATVINTAINNDGAKEQGITFPSGVQQKKLMQDIFREINVRPSEISYVEAHATGTKVGDPTESNVIVDVFCAERESPLLVGSVKSNMGHSESVSGLCSIVKTILAMESGIIAPNLHFHHPNAHIPGLSDGRLEVVSKPCQLTGCYTAVDCFGFGGANAHVILKSNTKLKGIAVKDDVPRLVCVSGRTKQAVNHMLDRITTLPQDNDLIALLHSIHSENIPGHDYRGFTVLNGTIPSKEEISRHNHKERRQTWFVFSGMGSQWAGMSKNLFKLKIFDQSFRKAAQILKPEGFDLYSILNTDDNSVFDDVVNSSVFITVIQVALTDFLKTIAIEPDHMIGHSVGELGCAYADGALTMEQTILIAYWRARSIIDSRSSKGSMASIGLTWNEIRKRVTHGISLACHNSADNVTVSGPPEYITKLVEQLKSENIFAKEVHSSGCAFHSKYIADAVPGFQKYLERVIPNPKPRTSRWISSSVPESDWDSPLAQLASVDYYVNNLLSPVLFHEALQHTPQNAIVIEIAPHTLLQPILKRTLGPTATVLGLVKKGYADNLEFLLNNLGKYFNAGGQLKLNSLYDVKFPVPKGTPMIQSMVEWDHSVDWSVPDFSNMGRKKTGETIVEVDVTKVEHEFYTGHVIEGRVLFPAAGYLTLVWKTFANLHGKSYEEFPVIVENVQLLRATVVSEGAVKFLINFLNGSGEFEICESGSMVVRGMIKIPEDVDKETLKFPPPNTTDDQLPPLSSSDIYKELGLRGYDYAREFRVLKSSNIHKINGNLHFNGNYVTFMDGMLQYGVLSRKTNDLYVPTRIQRILIDPIKQKRFFNSSSKDEGLAITNYEDIGVVSSAGVEMRGINFSFIPRRQQPQPKLEKCIFIPFDNQKNDGGFTLTHALICTIQLVIENNPRVSSLKIAEACETHPKNLLAPELIKIFKSEPSFSKVDYTVTLSTNANDDSVNTSAYKIVTNKTISRTSIEQNCHLVVITYCAHDPVVLRNAADTIKTNGFIISIENTLVDEKIAEKFGLIRVSKLFAENKIVYLFRKVTKSLSFSKIVSVSADTYDWVNDLKTALSECTDNGHRVLLVSQGDHSGIIGAVNCMIKEPGGNRLRSIFIQNRHPIAFSPTDPEYETQLRKDLVHNVYKSGIHGTYRHLPLENLPEKSSTKVEHAYVNTSVRGDLASLRWFEGPLRPGKHSNVNICDVYYAALNFRDVMLATGKLPPNALPADFQSHDCILGLEFSGRDRLGKRVMGIVFGRSLATSVSADPAFLWQVPDHWSLEEASTVPAVYATAYYSLIVRGQLKPGETLLIHAGTGGVGQASISIALSMKCTVYTTVGSAKKREFLKTNFPQLTDDNIANSRDTTFESHVMSQTKGKGVDLVVNSLAEDKLQASVRCLGKNGRFLEIGKLDLSNNTSLGMSIFLKNTSFHGILLDALFEETAEHEEKKKVFRLLSEGIQNGTVKPLQTTVFSSNQMEEAFRYMASGKHIGKVVIMIKDEKSNISESINVIPRTYMHPDKSYIIIGGLGGFGLELANWLIIRNATKIILSSRTGIKTAYQALCVKKWQQKGIQILVSTQTCATTASTTKLLDQANLLGPVGGIFNLAVVLRDALIENLTPFDFAAVAEPKVIGTKNLDAVSRNRCPNLDYFVVFSSIVSGRGNPGQTNYGFANSLIERICETRHADGLPAIAIQWGAIADVGILVEKLNASNDIVVGGTRPQKMQSCLDNIDHFLQQPYSVVGSFVLAEKHNGEMEATSGGIVDSIANILGIRDIKNLNMSSRLIDLGMDSLMGAEIKQILERDFDMVLSLEEIRNSSFTKLLSR